MPVAPACVMAPCSEVETPKLRSSCDGCGTAKVKCHRERPKCGRCATLNLACIYGPSRKFGKPARKRLASDTCAGLQKRICTSRTTTQDHDKTTTTGFREHQSFSEPAQENFSHQAVEIVPISSGVNSTLGINEQSHLTSDFYPSLPFEEWPQLGEWPQLEIFGANLDFPSASPLRPASAVTKSSSSHESHSCPRDSYEIFRDLICPSPSLHAPESNSTTVSAQLDQVLQFNRNAVDRLSQVLRCPCAKSGHRAMVHASIVSRILIWYQQAAGWTGSSSWGPRPSASVDSATSSRMSPSPSPQSPSRIVAGTSATSSPSLVQATGFDVEHVPVSIGAFSIEDQNVQAAFRNQLVLSELRKTADLIEMFKNTSQDVGESSTGGSTSLYSHLGAWLQSEHSRTVTTLRSRLRTLNENLAS
ncbi:hypothetical protein BGZ60DRAFT_404400 [Tricladium varicosporioides]|nr:hypothetical protein BGZ60DRAFT_404400 [Hymenoscyphus varicosporioides]